MRKSPTLAGLSTAPSVQVWKGDAASRCCNIWAPEFFYSGGKWYLYFVAGQNISDYNPTQRTHVLESSRGRPGSLRAPRPRTRSPTATAVSALRWRGFDGRRCQRPAVRLQRRQPPEVAGRTGATIQAGW
jgi:hypothetical protein